MINTTCSVALAAMDKLLCNAHTWWLLNSELARTNRSQKYMENNRPWFEADGGYGHDEWSSTHSPTASLNATP